MVYYIRDEEGNLIGFKYNNTIYYYIKNMQEDIIGLTDSSYNLVCSYEYDSWGKLISIKGDDNNIITNSSHIGYINPFRYRSYYYDNETKLYYLNSRYYNPEWGRFVNADRFISTDTGLLGFNMYAYCNNEPILRKDYSGSLFGLVLGMYAVIAGVIIGAEIIDNNNKKQNKKAKKEIEEVQRKNNVCPVEDNKNFKETLKKNAQKVQQETQNMNYIERLNYLRENANDGQKFDLKLFTKDTIFYDGMYMEPQDIGNYHFGYIGRASGIQTWVLLKGASVNQIKKMNWEVFKNCFTTSFCDDPRDQYFIKMGAIAYDKERKNK